MPRKAGVRWVERIPVELNEQNLSTFIRHSTGGGVNQSPWDVSAGEQSSAFNMLEDRAALASFYTHRPITHKHSPLD